MAYCCIGRYSSNLLASVCIRRCFGFSGSDKDILFNMRYKLWSSTTTIRYYQEFLGNESWRKYAPGISYGNFHDLDNHPISNPLNLTKTIYTLASEKLVFWSVQYKIFTHEIWNNPATIHKLFVCQSIAYNKNMTYYTYNHIWLWGVSAKAKKFA